MSINGHLAVCMHMGGLQVSTNGFLRSYVVDISPGNP